MPIIMDMGNGATTQIYCQCRNPKCDCGCPDWRVGDDMNAAHLEDCAVYSDAPKFRYSDGGRAKAGFKGQTGDCVTRAIAIAAGLPYRAVYDEIKRRKTNAPGRSRAAKSSRRNPSPRDGVHRRIYEPLLFELGFVWEPLMSIGSGCKVHVREEELPKLGSHVLSLSRHIAAWIDGVLHDIGDCSRGGTRCVYGIYSLPDSDYTEELKRKGGPSWAKT